MEHLNKKEQQQAEDIFKEKLGNFSPNPPAMNWKKIANQMEGKDLDDFAKSSFENFEQSPNPKVWNNIKRELPLSLWVRSHLNALSKIAAVLMVFMVAILVMDKKETPQNITPVATKATETTPVEEIIPEAAVDFVFAIETAPSKKIVSASEELSLEDEKTIEDFWSLMDDEEDFIAEVNDSVIQESLKPILQLPIENLQAALPSQGNRRDKNPSLILPNRPASNLLNIPIPKKKVIE